MKTRNFKLIHFFIDPLIQCFNGSIFTLIISTTLFAQWSTDPYNNFIVGYGLLPEIASDSASGCYITYEGGTTSYPRQLILHRLNRYGNKPWASSKRILGELPEQSGAKIIEDGSNGVIISYLDIYWSGPGPGSAGYCRLRVQRVDSSGNFLWGSTGVRVSLTETNQGDQAIVSDGQGGCIVAWQDTLNQIRLQRIHSSGTRLWGDSGMYVASSSWGPRLVSDISSNCIIAVYGQTFTWFQKFDISGTFIWGSSGVMLYNFPTTKIISDEANGAILAGMRYISYNNGDPLWAAEAQRLDPVGQILWGINGLILEDSLQGLYLNPPGIQLTNNVDGGSTIAWGTRTIPGVLDLRTQIVRSDGSTVFPYGGIPISRASSQKSIVGVLPSDSMTSIYVWGDSRSIPGTYAQKLDTLGKQRWDTNDVVVSFSQPVKAVTDGNGGFIAIVGGQYFAIRVQQVNKYGQLGQVITSVENESNQFPQKFLLHQNYPNPFNPVTLINYQLPTDSWVTLKVYDVLGREVATLVNEHKQAGNYNFEFRTSSASGGFEITSGVYIYRFTAGNFSDMKKMLLLR